MERFSITEHRTGWVYIVPSDDAIHDAVTERELRNRRHWHSFEANARKRWIGTLGEDCAAAWLDHVGWPYEAFGGADDLPDLSVAAGRNVSVKTTWCEGNYLWQYHVNVPAQHIRDPRADELLFLAWENKPNRMVLLGGCSAAWFRGRARLYRRGEQLPNRRRTPATNDVWVLDQRHLDRPWAWLSGQGARAIPELWVPGDELAAAPHG